MATHAAFAGLNRIYDPSTGSEQNGSAPPLYPNRANRASRDVWKNTAFSSRNNSQILGAYTKVLEDVTERMLITDDNDPFTQAIMPSIETPELNVVRAIKSFVRNIVPYGPHRGVAQKQRIRRATLRRTQTRKLWSIEIDQSMLFSAEGVSEFYELVQGAAQNIRYTNILEIMWELLTSSDDEKLVNSNYGSNPYLNMGGLTQQSQDIALQEFLNLRVQVFNSLGKRGRSFEAIVSQVERVIKARGGRVDGMIIGPGVKHALTLGTDIRTNYYLVGPSGQDFYKRPSDQLLPSYCGWPVYDVTPFAIDADNHTPFDRNVEVGEYYTLLGSHSSEIRIYEHASDGLVPITKRDIIEHCHVWDADGSLNSYHDELVGQYNSKSLQWAQTNNLSKSTVAKIKPHQLSVMLYENAQDQAAIAKVFGQTYALTSVKDNPNKFKEISQSLLACAGVTPATASALNEGLTKGIALSAAIRAEPKTPAFWDAIVAANQADVQANAYNEVGMLSDYDGNSNGSLIYPTAEFARNLGQGFNNGVGMREMASRADAAGANAKCKSAKAFVETVQQLVDLITPAVGTSHALDPAYAAPWFHKATAVSCMIDLLIGVEAPVWIRAGTSGASPEASSSTGTSKGTEKPATANPAAKGGKTPSPTDAADAAALATVVAAAAASGATLSDKKRLLAVLEKSLTERKLSSDEIPEMQKILLGAMKEPALADQAQHLLQELVQSTSKFGSGTFSGAIASLDIEAGIALRDADNVQDVQHLVAYLIGLDDISPRAYLTLDAKAAKETIDRIRLVAANYNDSRDDGTYPEIAKAMQEQAKGSNKHVKALIDKYRAANKQLNKITDTNFTTYETAVAGAGAGRGFVRVPLTVPLKYLETDGSVYSTGDGAIVKGSNPYFPAAIASAKYASASGTAFIAASAHKLEHSPFFVRALEPLASDVEPVRIGAKRSRLAMDSDDEAPAAAPAARRDATLAAFGMDDESTSYAAVGSAASRIGAAFPRFPRVPADSTADEMRMSRGDTFHSFYSSSFAAAWESLARLHALDRVLVYCVMLMGTDRDSALALADCVDGVFGGVVLRAHISHNMSSVMIGEFGPSTGMVHHSESNILPTIANNGVITWQISWQSTPFHSAPDLLMTLFDVKVLRYLGGYGVSWEQPGVNTYDIDNQVARADLVAILTLPSLRDLPNPIGTSGVYHFTGYNNSSNHTSVSIPHIPGQPFADHLFKLSARASVGLEDTMSNEMGNTTCFAGMQYNLDPIEQVFKRRDNTGHFGPYKENDGFKAQRMGSAYISVQ